MKFNTLLYLALLTVSFGLFASCKDKNPERQEMVDITPVEVKKQATYYITTVNNLRGREGELKSSKVVNKIKEGTIVKYLNEESKSKETITLRGKSYTEPYKKILVDGTDEMWVYGGGLEVFHSGDDIDDISSINNFKTYVSNLATNDISNGNVILKKLMQVSTDNPSTNDALYFMSKDYLDKLSYQATLEFDKQGISMSPEDYKAIIDRTYDMNSSRIGKDGEKNGFVLIASEGMVGYKTDPYALEGAIGGIFSPAVKEYIRLQKNQYKHRLFSDAAISGSMENLMNDVIAWSNFKERYPKFTLSKEVNSQVNYLKSSLFNGTLNTPAFDPNSYIAKKEFRDIWNTTLETYPNAPFAKELYDHVQKLETNNWMFEEQNQ